MNRGFKGSTYRQGRDASLKSKITCRTFFIGDDMRIVVAASRVVVVIDEPVTRIFLLLMRVRDNGIMAVQQRVNPAQLQRAREVDDRQQNGYVSVHRLQIVTCHGRSGFRRQSKFNSQANATILHLLV